MSSTIKRASLAEFRSACDKARTTKEAVGAVLIPKGFASEAKAVDGEERAREFIASTGDVDRDGDTIDPAGWELGPFSQSGAFLWAHDHTGAPIGTPIATYVEGAALKIRVRFPAADMPHPLGLGFGHTVMRMYDEGLLRGVSVGFIPREWAYNEERGGGMFGPMDFKRQELLEVSAVPVPANPYALVIARAKGIDTAPIVAWAETVRDSKTGLWVHRDAIASLLDQAAGEKTYSIPAPAKVEDPKPEPVAPAAEPEAKDVEPLTTAFAAVEKAEGDLVAKIAAAAATIAKQGRVLSKKNEDDLRSASDMILRVLSQVQSQDDDKACCANVAKSITANDVRDIVSDVVGKTVDGWIAKNTGRLPL